jgi:outer membrane receptor protein involved in Fe transport
MRVLIIFFINMLFIFACDKNELLKTINETNDIAYKNRLNLEKIPYNMTVLRRDFIIKSGARTLLDLFRYIPGVEIAYTSTGKPEIIIRGNKNEFVDKIKLFINGIEVSNDLFNSPYIFYSFPAALIKRVEFKETPDSVSYGPNAFLGIINVVTLDTYDNNLVSFSLSDKNEKIFSVFKKFSNNLLVDFHYSYSNPVVYSPNIYLADVNTFEGEVFRGPTRANTLNRHIGIGIRYKKYNSKINYRLEFQKKGDFFGVERITPLKRDKYSYGIYQNLNYNYSRYFRFDLKNNLDIGVTHYRWYGEFRTFPYDYNESVPHNDPSKDIIYGADFNEIEFYLKNRLNYKSFYDDANFLIELKYSKPFNYYSINYIPALSDKKELRGSENFLKGGIKIFSTSFAIEDLKKIDEKVYVSLGYRIDRYSNFGYSHSYKIGGVYNKSEYTTFKLLFNRAVRTPSLLELYTINNPAFNGNEDLKPESIKMLEFVWIQRIFSKDKFKLIVYNGIDENFIGRELRSDGKRYYDNLGNIDIRGVEVSYKKNFKKVKAFMSYAFNNNSYKFSQIVSGENVNNYQGVNKHQIISYIEYNLNRKTSIFSSLFYGSKIHLPDFVGDIRNYFSLNINLNYKPSKDFIVSIGAENITNHKNYMMVFPENLIDDKHFFEFEGAKLPYLDKRCYVSLSKEW